MDLLDQTNSKKLKYPDDLPSLRSLHDRLVMYNMT